MLLSKNDISYSDVYFTIKHYNKCDDLIPMFFVHAMTQIGPPYNDLGNE